MSARRQEAHQHWGRMAQASGRRTFRGIGELVEHDDLKVRILDEVLDDVVADEAAATGDQAPFARLLHASWRVRHGRLDLDCEGRTRDWVWRGRRLHS